MQKEAEMGSKVLQMALSCCLGQQHQQRGRKVEKGFSSDVQFRLNSLVLHKCIVVLQLCIYSYTVSFSNVTEPARDSCLNYRSQCLPYLVLFSSHHLCNKYKGKVWFRMEALVHLTSLEVNMFRLGPTQL